MGKNVGLNRIYELFGVAEYAEKLRKEKNEAKIGQLNRVLGKYIALQAIEELSEDALQQLEKVEVKDGQGLFQFFEQNITDFAHKLEDYGRDFRRRFAGTGIIS